MNYNTTAKIMSVNENKFKSNHKFAKEKKIKGIQGRKRIQSHIIKT